MSVHSRRFIAKHFEKVFFGVRFAVVCRGLPYKVGLVGRLANFGPSVSHKDASSLNQALLPWFLILETKPEFP